MWDEDAGNCGYVFYGFRVGCQFWDEDNMGFHALEMMKETLFPEDDVPVYQGIMWFEYDPEGCGSKLMLVDNYGFASCPF
jgi:hypothetical protein